MSTLLLQVNDVYSGYDDQDVVRGISFDMVPGTLTSLVGPNGHGKTTLLRTISGLLNIRKGEIRFQGQALQGLSADKCTALGIVHIPQGDLVFSDMTVRENLFMGAYLPAAHARRHQREAYVYDLLPKLAERRHQIASTLSGGERRMLAIGRALMSQSELLLIDEPSLGLAPIVIEQVYDIIRALKDEGRTILLVEENADRVVDLSDKVYLLDNGQFVWSGKGAELTRNEALVRTYLGG